ncbi:SycD/LcrH family type III secretion system chaperone [Stenotrophomonas maltophilia]|nr:SycD/LcrH family type III secretion system chaperone [Stenotrophomonas maltophilia]
MNTHYKDAADVSESTMVEALLESLRSGVTLRELKGVDDTTMEAVYAYAHQFYVNGQLDEAEKFFRFLYMFDFHNGDYVFGLASVYQLKKDYQKAIDLYAVAYALVRQDERPLFHAGQCHLALGRRGMARGCFEDVLSRCRDEEMADRARTYLELIAEGAPKDAFDSTAAE